MTIGGYGGEMYRYFQIAPYDQYREKVWDVVTECVRIQERESKAVVTCSSVAKKIHDYQVENGLQKLIYHRPVHGAGMEGRQAPWLALGDYTVLEEGMMFSLRHRSYFVILFKRSQHDPVSIFGTGDDILPDIWHGR